MKTFEELYYVVDSLKTLGGDSCTIWAESSKELRIVTNLNDYFWWGTSDNEFIEPEDITHIKQSYDDIEQLLPGEGDISCIELWACRKRGMRPQGACYRSINSPIRGLFDQAGPPREVNLGNPYSTSGEYEYK